MMLGLVFRQWGIVSAACLFLLLVSFGQAAGQSVYKEFSGNISAEYSYFWKGGLYPGQHQHYPSISFQPEYFMEWKDGAQSFKFVGFARIDRDSKRTHFDVRELYWQKVKNNWELSVGLKKVFWGVTESVHLVDIVNQTDVVESFDGEQKLGQPMVHFSYMTGFGTFDVFAMPYFRKRQFPGEAGRLRTPFLLERNESTFESGAAEARPDFAVRWSHYFGPFDIGLSHFYGTGREPFLGVNEDSTTFNPHYVVINQTGIDLQATTGPMLWKVESIVRLSDIQDMFAIAAGFEYTFGNIMDSGLDIGIVGEYLFDNRGDLAFSSLQSDVFVGARFAFNDTQSTSLLMGAIFDYNRSTRLYSLEAERRIGQSWKAEAELRMFSNVANNEFLYFVRQDSFLRFTLGKYF